MLNAFNTMTFESCVISILSYFDEYDNHFGKHIPEEKKETIAMIYRRVKKDIKRFRVLKDFRNQILGRDYGIVGNVISGQVTGDTAKQLSENFGKISQRKR